MNDSNQACKTKAKLSRILWSRHSLLERRKIPILLNHIGRLLRHRIDTTDNIATHVVREHRRIGNPQSLHALHLQPRVKSSAHRHRATDVILAQNGLVHCFLAFLEILQVN